WWMFLNGDGQSAGPADAGVTSGDQEANPKPLPNTEPKPREPAEAEPLGADSTLPATNTVADSASGEQDEQALLSLCVVTQHGPSLVDAEFGSPAPGTVRVVSVAT